MNGIINHLLDICGFMNDNNLKMNNTNLVLSIKENIKLELVRTLNLKCYMSFYHNDCCLCGDCDINDIIDNMYHDTIIKDMNKEYRINVLGRYN